MKTNSSIVVNGITVDLLDDCVQVHQGGGVTKFIAYEVFIDLLNKIANKDINKDRRVEYHLPNGTYFFDVSSGSMKISCYYPECIRKVTYRSRGLSPRTFEGKIVVPNLVITHSLTKKDSYTWSVTDSRYYVTYKFLIELDRRFPSKSDLDMEKMCFTNVYDDARLCYGENVRVAEVKLPDLKPLNWYYEILFISPFNDDLGLPTLVNSKFREHPDTWYKHLGDLALANKPFPYNELTKFKPFMTAPTVPTPATSTTPTVDPVPAV